MSAFERTLKQHLVSYRIVFFDVAVGPYVSVQGRRHDFKSEGDKTGFASKASEKFFSYLHILEK